MGRDVEPETLDRVLDLLDRRGLSACEMRVLLALRERDASIAELASRLDRKTGTIRHAGRRLSARGLVRWRHVGELKTTALGITAAGLATTRSVLTAIGDVQP